MTRLLASMAMLLVILTGCTTAKTATPKEIPDCNSPAVRNAVGDILRGKLLEQAKDLKSDAGKRWCTVRANVYLGKQWASTARMWYDDYQQREVIYIWVQTK